MIQIPLQYCNELTQQAIQQAKESNTVLPKNFSIKRIVAECIDDLKMNKEIIAVMAHLQRSGQTNQISKALSITKIKLQDCN